MELIESCIVCQEERHAWKSFPCSHQVSCLACICKSEERKCPICHLIIQKVSYGNSRQPMSLDAHLRFKRARDEDVLEDVFQVVVVGPPDSGRDQIVAALKKSYPPDADRCITQLEIPCEYACNSKIGPSKIRISANRAQVIEHEQTESLMHEKADVLVICASAQSIYAFYTFLRWYNMLRASDCKVLWLLTPGIGMYSPTATLSRTQELVSTTPEVVSDEVTFCCVVEGTEHDNTTALGNTIIRLSRETRYLRENAGTK